MGNWKPQHSPLEMGTDERGRKQSGSDQAGIRGGLTMGCWRHSWLEEPAAQRGGVNQELCSCAGQLQLHVRLTH